MKNKSNTKHRISRYILICFLFSGGLLIIFPLYICIVFALKTPLEIASSPLSIPIVPHFENFTEAIKISNYFLSFKNTIIGAGGSVLILLLCCSMAGYIISRRGNKRAYSVIYYLFLASIYLPFQSIMFPLYRMMKNANLLNTLYGLVLALAGVQAGLFIFFYVGFVKTVPRELEEAARIDGCSKLKTFWRIIFPILTPINMTIVILGTLNAWNDFAISLIMVSRKSVRTISLTLYNFVSEYFASIHLAFSVLVISVIPMVIIFIFFQKNITSGITAGSVKG